MRCRRRAVDAGQDLGETGAGNDLGLGPTSTIGPGQRRMTSPLVLCSNGLEPGATGVAGAAQQGIVGHRLAEHPFDDVFVVANVDPGDVDARGPSVGP